MSVDSAGYLYVFEIYTGKKGNKDKDKKSVVVLGKKRKIGPRRKKKIHVKTTTNIRKERSSNRSNTCGENVNTSISTKEDDSGLGPKIVKDLSSQYPDGERFVFVGDNYFSSVDLIRHLKQKGQYYIGTIRKNRK